MENHIKITPPANEYLDHFRRAWNNLRKLSREEERRREYIRRGRSPRKQA